MPPTKMFWLAFLLLPLSAYAQLWETNPQTPSFELEKITETTGLLITGQFNSTTNWQNFGISNQGDSLFVNDLGTRLPGMAFQAANNDFWYYDQKMVTRTDQNGTIIWNRDLATEGATGTLVITGFNEQPDGAVLLGTHDGVSVVILVNENGQVDLLRTYPGNTDLQANAVVSDDGHIYFAKVENNGVLTCQVYKKLASNGNAVATNDFGIVPSEYGELLELRIGSDGHILLLTKEGTTVSANEYHTLRKLDAATLIPIWERNLATDSNYSPEEQEVHFGGYDIIGNYLVACYSKGNDGTYYDPPTFLALNLVFIDYTTGEFLTTKNHNEPDIRYQPTKIKALFDGSFVVAGQKTNSQSNLTENFVRKHFISFNDLQIDAFYDFDEDCADQNNEARWAGKMLVLESTTGETYYEQTDANGKARFIVEGGDYSLYAGDQNSPWGINCQAPITFSFPSNTGSDTLLSLPISPLVFCQLMNVDLSTSSQFTLCFEGQYRVSYSNQGTITATGSNLVVELDPDLTYVSSSIPLDIQNGNSLYFDLGDVAALAGATFTIDVAVDCTAELGQTHCSKATILPYEGCHAPIPGYDGSIIEALMSCNNGIIDYTIGNGGADMATAREYRIFKDDLLVEQGMFFLDGSISNQFPADGSTYRIEAEQSPNSPYGSIVSATVEGCNSGSGPISIGFLPQFSENDELPFISKSCIENVGSYDPNDKQAFPKGLGMDRQVAVGSAMEYLIRFQNTGTAPARNVLITDEIDENLDLATFNISSSSHNYRIDFSGGQLLVYYDNIMLPDSNANEALSHGYFAYSILPNEGLAIGETFTNDANIYFDFNAPILTNETFHTYGIDYEYPTVCLEHGVTTEDNEITIAACLDDTVPDSYSFSNDLEAGFPYYYILTDDQGLMIAAYDGYIDFNDNFPVGTYSVYGLANYVPPHITAGAHISTLETNGCGLSTNVVQVILADGDDPICLSGTKDTAAILAFSIQPNPSSGFFNLDISLNEKQAVEVGVYDLNGHLVKRIYQGQLVEFNTQIDLTALAGGLYVVQVKNEDGVYSKKLVKMD